MNQTSWHVKLEMRKDQELVLVGSCGDPSFTPGTLRMDRCILSLPPAFRIGEVNVEKWLKKHLFIVTRESFRGTTHSSTSWVCTFRSCGSISKMEQDLYFVRDLLMDI